MITEALLGVRFDELRDVSNPLGSLGAPMQVVRLVHPRSRSVFEITWDGATAVELARDEGAVTRDFEDALSARDFAERSVRGALAEGFELAAEEEPPSPRDLPSNPQARHLIDQAMEARLRASPNDLAAWRAYAHWLSDHGDPRGELMEAQIREGGEILATDEAHQSASSRTLAEHARHLFSGVDDVVRSEWKLGFLSRVVFQPDPENPAAHVFRTLLRAPSARMLTAIEVVNRPYRTAVDTVPETYAAVMEVLASDANVPGLSELAVGRIASPTADRVEFGPLGFAVQRQQGLKRLAIRGLSAAPPILTSQLPHALEALELRTTLHADFLGGFASNTWRHLSTLIFGGAVMGRADPTTLVRHLGELHHHLPALRTLVVEGDWVHRLFPAGAFLPGSGLRAADAWASSALYNQLEHLVIAGADAANVELGPIGDDPRALINPTLPVAAIRYLAPPRPANEDSQFIDLMDLRSDEVPLGLTSDEYEMRDTPEIDRPDNLWSLVAQSEVQVDEYGRVARHTDPNLESRSVALFEEDYDAVYEEPDSEVVRLESQEYERW